MSDQNDFEIQPLEVEVPPNPPIERTISRPLTGSQLGLRRSKKSNYFADSFQIFKYNFHKEGSKSSYLETYISKVVNFVERQKVETSVSCRFSSLKSSSTGEIYFLDEEGSVVCLDGCGEESVVVPERRDGFLLFEGDWDDKLRLVDDKLSFSKSHPISLLESTSNHPNFFSYKKALLISWDRGFIYFYNLFAKVHAKPIPHSFDILGLGLGKFETLIVADKRKLKIVAFNIFSGQSRELADYAFSVPCILHLEGENLYIENAPSSSIGHERGFAALKQCKIVNLASQRSLLIEGMGLFVSRAKPMCYYLSKKGALVIKNYANGVVLDEIKLRLKPIEMLVSGDEKFIFFFALNIHPLSDFIKVVCWDLAKKKRRMEYDLNYAPTNFFVNKIATRLLHWEVGAPRATMEELSTLYFRTERLFDRFVDKVDFGRNAAYYFESGILYKLDLASNEKKVIMQRGDHIFRQKGGFYFIYSPGILCIFDKNDTCLFDDYARLNHRLKQSNNENGQPEEQLEEKSLDSVEEAAIREEIADQVKPPQNSCEQSESQNPDRSPSMSNPTDSATDRFYDRLRVPQQNFGRKNIATLVRINNPNMDKERERERTFAPEFDQNHSVMSVKVPKEPTELNWIYFLDFIEGEPPAFYFLNSETFQILVFEDPKLELQPKSIFLEDYIYDGRVSQDQIFFFALNMDGVIKLWNIQTLEKLRTFSVKGCYFELSLNERRLYVLSKSGWLHIVDIETDLTSAELLIDSRGITDTYPSLSIQESENPNELLIHYSDSLRLFLLKPRINVWEYQYIKSFFKVNKIVKKDEFNANIACFRHVYKHSPLLKEYFNPIYIAALYSISLALDNILSKNLFAYPLHESQQIKPLLLALYNRDLSIIEVICEHLIQMKSVLYLTYEEMLLLMSIDFPYTKAVLAKTAIELNAADYDSSVYEWPQTLSQEVVIVFQRSKTFNANSLEAIKEANSRFLPRMLRALSSLGVRQRAATDLREQSPTVTSMREAAGSQGRGTDANSEALDAAQKGSRRKIKITTSISKNIHKLFTIVAKKKVKYYMVTGRFNFHDGSADSRYFLTHYSKSAQTNFVLSRFRLIIIDKWARLGFLYKVEAFIFLLLTVSLNIYFFIPEISFFFYSSLVLLCFYLFYEGLSFYVEPRMYFKNPDNILDVLGFTSGLTMTIISFLFLDKDNFDQRLLHFFQMLTLFIFFFRLTTYLKAFDTLNPVITMIYAVAYDIWDILLIFTISIVVFSLLLLKTDADSFGSLMSKEYFSFYGQVPDDLVDDNNYVKWLILIGSTLFITLVMSNFIVARMNNNYSKLETTQIEVTLKEKARLLLEFETLLNIFPKYRREIENLRQIKYHAVIAQDANAVNDYEDFLQNKIDSSTRDYEHIEGMYHEIGQHVKRLNGRIKKVEMKTSEVMQSLKEVKLGVEGKK